MDRNEREQLVDGGLLDLMHLRIDHSIDSPIKDVKSFEKLLREAYNAEITFSEDFLASPSVSRDEDGVLRMKYFARTRIGRRNELGKLAGRAVLMDLGLNPEDSEGKEEVEYISRLLNGWTGFGSFRARITESWKRFLYSIDHSERTFQTEERSWRDRFYPLAGFDY